MAKIIKRIELVVEEEPETNSYAVSRVFDGMTMFELIGFLSMEVDRLREKVFTSWAEDEQRRKEVRLDGNQNQQS